MTMQKQGGFGFLHVVALILLLVVGAGYLKYQSKKEAERTAVVAAQEAARLEEEAERKRQADAERREFDARVAAEKQKSDFVKSLQALESMETRWRDAVKIASVTGRINLPQPVANLQTIRREADALMLPACLETAKVRLVSSMELTIEGFMAFMGDSKHGETLSSPYFSGATKASKEYREKVQSCSAVVAAAAR